MAWYVMSSDTNEVVKQVFDAGCLLASAKYE